MATGHHMKRCSAKFVRDLGISRCRVFGHARRPGTVPARGWRFWVPVCPPAAPGANPRHDRAAAPAGRVARTAGLPPNALSVRLPYATAVLAGRLLPCPGVRWSSVWPAAGRVAGGLARAGLEEKADTRPRWRPGRPRRRPRRWPRPRPAPAAAMATAPGSSRRAWPAGSRASRAVTVVPAPAPPSARQQHADGPPGPRGAPGRAARVARAVAASPAPACALAPPAARRRAPGSVEAGVGRLWIAGQQGSDRQLGTRHYRVNPSVLGRSGQEVATSRAGSRTV